MKQLLIDALKIASLHVGGFTAIGMRPHQYDIRFASDIAQLGSRSGRNKTGRDYKPNGKRECERRRRQMAARSAA